MKRLTMILISVFCGAMCCSCGSDATQGYTFAPTHSAKIKTVSVPIFQNDSYKAGMERTLTEAIIKEIQKSTHWTVVSGGSADATLTGTMKSANYSAISTNPSTGLDQEMGVNLRVDFDLKDNRTGKAYISRRSFQYVDTFVADRNVSERQEIGQNATIDGMAKQIVAELRDSW